MTRTGDACVDFYVTAMAASGYGWPQGSRLLEIGCAEADWLSYMHERRPDLRLVGIDWRACARPVPVIQGNVLTRTFADLDGVVMVSTLEHIGLGHYATDAHQTDPVDVDGDRHLMALIVHWLRPGGLVYLDVPYQPDRYQVVGTSHREYDDQALRDRVLVPGLVERWRGFVYAGDTVTLVPPPTERAQPFYYVGLVLEKVA